MGKEIQGVGDCPCVFALKGGHEKLDRSGVEGTSREAKFKRGVSGSGRVLRTKDSLPFGSEGPSEGERGG